MLIWAKKLGVTPSKHGSKQFVGNSCRKLLENIDSLTAKLPRKYKTYGKVLKAFNDVRRATFGFELEEDFEEKVKIFEMYFKDLQIPVFPKAHQVMHHLVEFVSRHGPLGPFCEQSFESAHHEFSKVWKNYKREIGHREYAQKLMSAGIDFNTMRI